MSLDQKKEMALFLFYRRLQVHKYQKHNRILLCHSVSECYEFWGCVMCVCACVCTCVSACMRAFVSAWVNQWIVCINEIILGAGGDCIWEKIFTQSGSHHRRRGWWGKKTFWSHMPTYTIRGQPPFAILHILHQVGVSDRSLRRWLKIFEEESMMIASQRGHHAKTISPIVDPDFKEKFCSYVRSESCKKGIFQNVPGKKFVTLF